MDISAGHSYPCHPTRFQGIKLPASRLEVRDIDTVLFVVEHGPLEGTLTNLLSTAALCRAITKERGVSPRLKIQGESQLWNSLHGASENTFTEGVCSGDHALLITAASLLKKQMAQLVGSYALSGATLDGYPHIVDDGVKLGDREDPRDPVRPLIEALLGDRAQELHVRELLRLARESECQETKDVTVLACRSALATLQSLSVHLLRKHNQERPEIIPTLNNMIREWSEGAVVPRVCESLIQRHNDAFEISRSIWESAREIAPGVFQLIEYPYDETDDVIRDQLKEIYQNDTRARYVLERGVDPAATSLSYEEALAFERRLGAGEEPQEILKEVEALMQERKDTSCAVDIAMAEIRDREPRDTLETILERARYIPDPDGVQYTIFKSPDDDLFEMMRAHDIPIITHNTLWLVDVRGGSTRPFMISFQGQHLEAFLKMIEA